jgi:hypothetical protein
VRSGTGIRKTIICGGRKEIVLGFPPKPYRPRGNTVHHWGWWSLRVAVIILIVIVLTFVMAPVLIFVVIVIVWLLSKEDIGSYQPIIKDECEMLRTCVGHVQWSTSCWLANLNTPIW